MEGKKTSGGWGSPFCGPLTFSSAEGAVDKRRKKKT